MKNFQEYAKTAINRLGLRGNNALARELGIKPAPMSRLIAGKSLPAESTIIKLAELAGLPKENALIDLNLWRSEKNPEIKTIWIRLSKMIAKCLIFAVFTVSGQYQKTSEIKDLETFNNFGQTQQIKDYATIIFYSLFAKIKRLIAKFCNRLIFSKGF